MPVDTISPSNYLNVIIDHKIWLRGQEAVDTGAYLMHPKSNKIDIVCSLLHSWSGERSILLGKRFVSQVAGHYAGRNRTMDRPLSFLLTPSHTDTAEAYALMQLNDEPALSDDEREQAIAKFLIQYGIGVRFGEAAKIKAPTPPKYKEKTSRLDEILGSRPSARHTNSISNLTWATVEGRFVASYPAPTQPNDTDI